VKDWSRLPVLYCWCCWL